MFAYYCLLSLMWFTIMHSHHSPLHFDVPEWCSQNSVRFKYYIFENLRRTKAER